MGYQAEVRREAIRAALSLSTIALLTTTAAAQVTVRGVLYDDARGTPLRGTVMLVDPSTDAAVVHVSTDSLGQFTLQAARGTYQLSAVRPGYQSITSEPIGFDNGERLTVRIPIAESGDPAHKIGVTEHIRPSAEEVAAAKRVAERRDDYMTGFSTRKAVGSGKQFTRADLDRSTEHTLGEFLQTVAGLHVVDPGSTNSMSMSRNASSVLLSNVPGSGLQCRIGWFIDGHRMDQQGTVAGQADPVTDALGSMSLDGIEGIEVFRGLSEMPAEFAAPDLRCGAVAVWTRRG